MLCMSLSKTTAFTILNPKPSYLVMREAKDALSADRTLLLRTAT